MARSAVTAAERFESLVQGRRVLMFAPINSNIIGNG